jgi:hypothetical protein
MRSYTRKHKRGGTPPTPPPLPPTRKSIPLDKLKDHVLAIERTRKTNKKFSETIAKMWAKMKQAERKSGSSSSRKKNGSSSHKKGGRRLTRTRHHKRK